MREFVFEIQYDTGSDALMDYFIETADARSKTFLCCMSSSELWRLDRIAGPSSLVEDVTDLLTDSSFDHLSISDRSCVGRHYTDVLERKPRRSLVYNYFSDLERCDSVPTITNRYVPGALLFDVTRKGDTERWRILMEDDQKAGMLYDTLGGSLRDGLTFKFEHITDTSGPVFTFFDSISLKPEQRRVLKLAAQNGYYETPRQTTLDDLATELEWPRSTVSYRLRKAEAALVSEFVKVES
jgi:predicted DNA binding protein